jgi:hypothetical protein
MVLACCGVGRAEPNDLSAFSGLVAEREAGSRLCIDMDDHFFVWNSGKVPSASSTQACYFDCSNVWLSCQSSVLDAEPPKTCLDALTACMAGCKGGSDAAARDWLGKAP